MSYEVVVLCIHIIEIMLLDHILSLQYTMAERKKKNSKTALQKVGSFLGVTEDDSQMNVWKEKCTERAQVLLQIFLICYNNIEHYIDKINIFNADFCN